MTGAVVRRWEATIARDQVLEWRDTLLERVFPKMKAINGFRALRVHAQHDQDPCRVTVFTEWDDMLCVRRFAGDDPAKAVIPDFMEPFFRSYDETATFHDELVLEASR